MFISHALSVVWCCKHHLMNSDQLVVVVVAGWLIFKMEFVYSCAGKAEMRMSNEVEHRMFRKYYFKNPCNK